MDTEPTKPITPTEPVTPSVTPPVETTAQPAAFQPTVKVEPTPTSPITDVVGTAPSQTPANAAVTQPAMQVNDGANNKPETSSSKISKLKLLLILLIVALVSGISLFGGYSVAKSAGDKKADELNNNITEITASTHPIPEGSIPGKVCIPNMGFHYLPPGADPEYGPWLLVNTKNEVIGVEYMPAPDMYTAIPDTNPAVSVVLKDSPMYGWVYDHFEVSYLPDGHHGLIDTHHDIHLYTVTKEVQKQACDEQ
jgi:hypothetical protein